MKAPTVPTVPGVQPSEPQVPYFSVQVLCLAIGTCLAGVFIWFLGRVNESSVAELTVGQLKASNASNRLLSTDWDPDSKVLSGAEKSSNRVLIWLGNSQLPTINQYQEGERNVVDIVHEKVERDGYYVMAFAPPNANLQEHYSIFANLMDRTHPYALLLPVFFDDLRETGIRPQLQGAFANEKTVARLSEGELGAKLSQETSKAPALQNATKEEDNSTLAWSEAKLNSFLEEHWSVWKARGTYRSLLFVKLHYLRNTVFGIKPQSVRRMIPERYDRNMNALTEMLDMAQKNGVHVVLYIPPIRNDVPIPYDLEAYGVFKNKMKELAEKRGIGFADLENAVAPDLWGEKVSTTLGEDKEIDFMHFSAKGHQSLAIAIEKLLRQQPWFAEKSN